MSKNLRRLEALEGAASQGPTALLIVEPGETTEKAVSRHEAKHGPLLPGQQWLPIITGVPRGELAWCA